MPQGPFAAALRILPFFLGSVPRDGDPIKLNGAIHITCTILKLVAASAAEAELGALFLNAQEAKVLRLILTELGHPQPKIPIHIDNTTAVGICNNTIKRQRSRAMEMRYWWLVDSEAQDIFEFHYHPGLENLGDYPSKHHPATVHQHVRPYYVHEANSPPLLPRAAKPSSRRGCAEILGTPYTKRYPLPSIPFTREQTLRESVPKSVHPREQMLTPERISQAHKPYDDTHKSSSASVPFSSSRISL